MIYILFNFLFEILKCEFFCHQHLTYNFIVCNSHIYRNLTFRNSKQIIFVIFNNLFYIFSRKKMHNIVLFLCIFWVLSIVLTNIYKQKFICFPERNLNIKILQSSIKSVRLVFPSMINKNKTCVINGRGLLLFTFEVFNRWIWIFYSRSEFTLPELVFIHSRHIQKCQKC